MTRTVLLFPLLSVACMVNPDGSGKNGNNGGDGEQGPVDADGDGLTDEEEAELGTDPDLADTDGDGFSDPDELELGYNALFEWSHPIEEGDYLVGTCPVLPDVDKAGHTGMASMNYNGQTYEWEAYQNGDILANWEGNDTFGQRISFYNFCGNYVMLVVSAAWCGPCQKMALTFEAEQEEIRAEIPNFQGFELLFQNTQGGTPDERALTSWKSRYGLDTIAVVGPDDSADPALVALDGDGYIPTTILVSPTMEVISMDEGLTGTRAVISAISRYESR